MYAPDQRYTDLTYLRKQTRANPTLLMEMISIYLEQTPALMDALKRGLKQNDMRLLEAAAHKIKPSFQIMGVKGNQEQKARAIQEMAASNTATQQAGELVNELDLVCKKVYEELTEELELLKNKMLNSKSS